MPTCSICIDTLKMPVSLPCGHIFCNECLIRAINAVKQYSVVRCCPTCRSPYSIVNIDSMLVPPHLRPHITPSIRRIYLDEPNPHIDKAMPNATALSECARLTAENNALRINGGMWCKRAQLHAAATIGLLHLARAARDQAIKLRREKEELEQNLNVLKRKIEAEDSFRKFSPPSSSKSLPSSSPNIHTSSDPSISIPQDSSRARTETHLPIHTRVPKFSCQTPLGCLTNEEIAILEEPPSKRRRILPES